MEETGHATGIDALNIIIIKRFKFPEPVFRPEDLKSKRFMGIFPSQGYKFLSDCDSITKAIHQMHRLEIKEGWELKPIKNIYIPQDNFWRAFAHESESIRLTSRKRLPFYPFQVIVDDRIDLNKEELEDHLQFKISDYKINIQARIFPPGAGTVHLYIYLKSNSLNMEFINSLFDLKNINIIYKNKEMDVHKFLGSFVYSLAGNLVNPRRGIKMDRSIPGYFTVVNFQGPSLPINQYLLPIAKMLTGKANPSEGEIDNCRTKLLDINLKIGRHEEDLFAISNRAALMYIDQGLKKTYSKILKGRRCARNHFIDVIELAYVTDWLLQEYNNYFTEVLRQLNVYRVDRSLKNKAKKFFTANILDPCAYSTLMYSIITVSENLSEIPWTNEIYRRAFTEFDLMSKIKITSKTTEELYKYALDWNVQVDAMKAIYDEMKQLAEIISKLCPSFG